MVDFKGIAAGKMKALIEAMNEEAIYDNFEIPKYSHMGDLAFPCFKLAGIFKKSPKTIAGELVADLDGSPYFEKIEAEGGYVNFTIDKGILARETLEEIFDKRAQFGSSEVGKNQKVIVEFSSTNIAKPFHIGHIRSTMIGNSLYRIHQFLGYDTVGINHLGDYGTQFGKLIVAFKRWGSKEVVEKDPIPELLKLYVRFHEEAEKHPEMEDEARMWFLKLEQKDPEAFELWQWIKEESLKEFNRVYTLLDVHFDSYAGESFYSDMMPEVLEKMRASGVLVKDQGAEIVDLSQYDMPPALVTKKDGSTLYITRDITAAIYRKEHYDFAKNIYVVGSQQQLHFKQWMKIIEMMGYDWAGDCIHVEFGTVALEEGSLSTRRGNIVFLEDVLKKAVEKTREIIETKNPNLENKDQIARDVGIGAVVFQELSNSRIKDYTFSWDKTLSFEGETGPYVQYTHARACSVLAKARIDVEQPVDYSLLKDDRSAEVIRLLSQFPQRVAMAAVKYEPSLISRYVVDLAQEFNRFYHDNPILSDDEAMTRARVALVWGVRQTLSNGLYLVGVKAPEKM
ncbi:MAG: arginine--tRNA ligase [delta proteobacterium ML8_F1]|nr:MAG: arginine--tRNA ligase [delta proteobacterium ML8_F1]